MANDKLNGSVDLLAQAMRGVFTEAVEQVGGDIKAEIKADMVAMEQRLEARIDTTNKNMQVQFAQNRQDVSEDFKKALQQTA